MSDDTRQASHCGESLRFHQSFLCQLAVGDVGVGAEPANYFAVDVANRNGAGEIPAIAPVFAANSEGIFPWFACRPRAFDPSNNLLDVIGMDEFFPFPAVYSL